MRTDLRRHLLAPLCLALAACGALPGWPPAGGASSGISSAGPSSAEEAPLRAMLAYYAGSPRPAAELATARDVHGGRDPYLLMQQAIHAGQSRPPDLARASNLLESVMKSTHPHAVNLAPLARLLHDQYGERQRLEQQLREAQRRGDQLQEKIDALSAIERSLPARTPPPPSPRSGAGSGQ